MKNPKSKIQNPKFISLLVLASRVGFLLLIGFLFSSPVFAAEGISISPNVSYVDIAPGVSAEREYVLKNDSSNVFEADISVQAFRVNPGEKTPILTNADGSPVVSPFTQFIAFEPKSVNLSPGAEQAIRVTVVVPQDKKIEDSEGKLIVFATEKNGSIVPGGSTVKTQIGALLLITQSGQLVDFSLPTPSWWSGLGAWKYIAVLVILLLIIDIYIRVSKSVKIKKIERKYSILDESDL